VTTEDRHHLARLLAEFEQCWDDNALAAQVPNLPPSGHPVRLLALAGMVKVDLRLNWRRGRYTPLEDYLRQYAELGTAETVAADLVYEEYQAQHALGQEPDLVAFTRRFPKQADELRKLITPNGPPPPSVPKDAPSYSPALKSNTSIHSTGPEVDPVLPEMFDRYRILKKLGQGGMGTVYLAHDTRLDRRVALKVPRFSPDQDRENLERFYREARATATIQHPNLCPLYDVGECGGTPYLTMSFIEGAPLSRYIRADKPLPQYTVATVVRVVAQAVAEAHKRGVIHRDLKPGNIMINQRGEPIVMDFGLARWVNADKEDTRLTRNGAILGAPVYMSPEQVYGDVNAMGPGCDVYSLGVILYEMLTARLPFEGPTTAVLAKTLIQEPVAPSKYRLDLDPRLEAICLKAMAKKIDDRYRSMDEIIIALTDYIRAERESRKGSGSSSHHSSKSGAGLSQSGAIPTDTSSRSGSRSSGNSTVVHTAPTVNAPPPQAVTEAKAAQPVSTRPETVPTSPRRRSLPSIVVPRRPVWPWVVLSLLLLIVGGLIAAVVYLFTPAAEGTIQIALDPCPPGVEIHVDGKKLGGLGAPLHLPVGKHDLHVEGDTIEPLKVTFDVFGGDNPPLRYQVNLRPVHRPAPQAKTFTGHNGAILAVALTADNRQAVTASADGIGYLWSLSDHVQFYEFKGHTGGINAVVLLNNKHEVITASDDKTLHVWDVNNISYKSRILTGHTGRVRAVAATSDSKRAVSGSDDKTVRTWDVAQGRQLNKFDANDAGVTCVAISPDNQRILSGGGDNSACLWGFSGKPFQRLTGHTGPIRAVAFLPDGQRALTASDDRTIRLWDLKTGNELKRMEGHTGPVVALALFDGGRKVVSASSGNGDNTLRVWDVNTGRALFLLGRTNEAIHGIAVSSDGKRVVSATDAHMPQVWDLSKQLPLPAPPPKEISTERLRAGIPGKGMDRVAVSADGRTALSAGMDGVVRMWDLADGKMLKELKGHTNVVDAVNFSPDGKRAVSGSKDKTARVWDLEKGIELTKFNGHTARVWNAVFTLDGKSVISGSDDGLALRWDAATGVVEKSYIGHTASVNWLTLSPDGKWLLTASHDETCRVWDVEQGNLIHTLTTGTKNHACVFIGDGTRALTGGGDRIVRLWDVPNSKELRRFEAHTGGVWAVSVSPGVRRFVSSGADKDINVWDIDSNRLLARFVGYTDKVPGVVFTPDGTRVVSVGQDGNLKVWLLPRSAIDPPPLADDQASRDGVELAGHAGAVECIAVSADGKFALSGSHDTFLRYRDLENNKELKQLDARAVVHGVAISADGKRGLSATYDKLVRYWDLENGTTLNVLAGHTDKVQGVALSPDGTLALSCASDRTVRLWDLQEGVQIKQLDGHTRDVWAVAFLPDGKHAVSGSLDGTVRLWDLETFRELSAWQLPADIHALAVSLDGRRILAGGKDRLVYLLDVQGGLVLSTFAGSKGTIATVAFSADGRWALSGGEDMAMRLWDIETGREVGRFLGHTGAVLSVAFTPDGKSALSTGRDKSVRRWKLPAFTALAKPGKRQTLKDDALSLPPDGRRFLSAALPPDQSLRVSGLLPR
jgi:WD40 repeat protein/serine/threonine protein kinase